MCSLPQHISNIRSIPPAPVSRQKKRSINWTIVGVLLFGSATMEKKMKKKTVTEEKISLVRSVVGGVNFSEMDIIRALHLSNNDATAAINILLDSPPVPSPASSFSSSSPSAGSARSFNSPSSSVAAGAADVDKGISKYNNNVVVDWCLVGTAEMSGLSTCKGRKIKAGDSVGFSFPSPKPNPPPSTPNSGTKLKFSSRVGARSSSSEIVRFSTQHSGEEIGRIPNEWARCLLPLVTTGKVRIHGQCKYAPDTLSIMDTILLSVSVYINISMFQNHHLTPMKSIKQTNDESLDHPLPALFRLLGLAPFRKAELRPEDLYSKKRSIESKVSHGSHAVMPIAENCRRLSSPGNDVVNESETISDPDVDNIVGISDASKLEEMEPPNSLECELRPYQKQALYWMVNMERGNSKDASTTIHPCWEAYQLADKRTIVIYLNAFSGDATTEFPSSLQMARGGILADTMGMGKTIMTISLLLTDHGKGDSSTSPVNQVPDEAAEMICVSRHSPIISKKNAKVSSFSQPSKYGASLVGGGNLIVCPMTLLGQWKAEIETHTHPECLTIYMHYGQSRARDANFLAQYDVVLTTYGVLASEFTADNSHDNGGLFCVQWFRVILDEAHIIKSSKSQISLAAASLSGKRRWCLTGTPIQNKLEDIYSILRFLKVEPWTNWGLWQKLVQKPHDEGNERAVKLVQSILRPVMLRRTKFSTDKEGRPILVLPPVKTQVIYCELTEAEKDFYEALYRRSKIKFDQFIEQGRVLHNYASILELLLRLRQCCDHPFLVMSRGDTQEFADLNKLAKRFLRGGLNVTGEDSNSRPSKAFVQEVVEELRKGEKGECPICLEAFEDAVITPCAHRLCRECLLNSWKSSTTGPCPICRQTIMKNDLITAPTESRFQIDVENNWVESSKVSSLLKELESHQTSGSKSIVFSQWTAFLDLLQIPLSRNSLTFVRLDGTLNQQQREKVIKQFTEDANVLVLLISLKAGGVGINLTAASNVFLMDPWWNPAVEEQAVMRVHRIGQSKSVTIKRFIVKGTVEERMVAVQERKQRMISGALTDQEVRTARIEELKLLFS